MFTLVKDESLAILVYNTLQHKCFFFAYRLASSSVLSQDINFFYFVIYNTFYIFYNYLSFLIIRKINTDT